MVYRRKQNRRYRRRYVKKSRGAPSTLANIASMAKTAYTGFKYVSRIINSEYKCCFVNSTSKAITRTGNTAINLLPVVTGTSQVTRNGNSVKPLNLSIKMFLWSNTGSTNSIVRVVIFRGNNENCVVPLQTNMFEDAGTAFSHKQDEKRFQTKFLYDKTYCLSNAERTSMFKDIEIRLEGHVNYDDNVSTTIPINGGIYILFIGDAYDTTNNPQANIYSRITFTDN